jgi:hypothetical protein
MTWRWFFSLSLALIIHAAWLSRPTIKAESSTPNPHTSDLIVAEVKPVLPPPAQPLPQPGRPDSPKPDTSPPQQFRPNTNMENPDNEANVPEKADEAAAEPPPKPPDAPTPIPPSDQDASPLPKPIPETPLEKEANSNKPKLTEKEIKEHVTEYRKQLAQQFNDSFTKVPELITDIGDPLQIPSIDHHFGITILAYSFVDHKPGAPFILFGGGQHQKIDNFDFSPFSNRIKDRMLGAHYRNQLKSARTQYRIGSLMKVIGLVPAATDHYFSTKQLRAVELAGLSLDQVKATHAHYAPYGADGFNLIVDSVVTKDGRTIAVQDEELRYSQ